MQTQFRFQSGFSLYAAEKAARLLSLRMFKPLHEFVRVSHFLLTWPLLFFILKLSHPRLQRVSLRHSQTMFGHYHLLLSDVDVSLVIEDATSDIEIREIGLHFNRLRRWLVFLGEFEVYTLRDFEMKREIETAWPSLVELIRVIRKFSWIHSDFTIPYHGYKSRQSLARNEIQLARLISSNEIQNLLASIPKKPSSLDAARKHQLASFLKKGRSKISDDLYHLIYYIAPTNCVGHFETDMVLPLPSIRLMLARHEEIQTRGRSRMLLAADGTTAERLELNQWVDLLAAYTIRLSKCLLANKQWAEFDVLGLKIRAMVDLSSQTEAAVFDQLIFEFEHFATEPNLNYAADVLIRIGSLRPSPGSSAWIVKTQLGQVDLKSRDPAFPCTNRTVTTPLGSTLHLLFNRRETELNFRSNAIEDSSILTNAVHSTLGERLEKNGFIRLHAAALETSEGAKILFADAGVGKSTFIVKHLQLSTGRVFTDETTWTKGGKVYPYPAPVAVDSMLPKLRQEHEVTRTFLNKKKYLRRIPATQISGVQRLARIIAVQDGYLKNLKWIGKVVLGLGLAQMAPYLLRPENATWIPRLAFRRLLFAASALADRKVTFQTKTEFRKLNNSAVNPP